MSAEKGHLYISTLPQETINILMKHRDVNGADRFIYALIHNLEFSEDNPIYKQLITNPDLKSAINGYMEHAEESGKINRCLKYLSNRNPNSDPHDLQEIVYFSVWRSFFTYPWETGYRESEFNTYLYTSIRWLTRETKQRKNSQIQLDEADLSEEKRNTLLKQESFLSQQPPNPEAYFFQKEARDYLVSKLIEETTTNPSLKSLKKTAFNLLSLGVEPNEIATLLEIDYPRLKGWLRASKKLSIVDTKDRVDTDAGGEWLWNQKTAQVILDNSYARKLLTEREIKLLTELSKDRSYTDITQMDSNLNGAEKSIKYKLRSHGVNTSPNQESFLSRRRQMVQFLNEINPVDNEERKIVDSLREAKGNINEAARNLNIPKGKVIYFLKQRGYYDK